MDAKQLYEKIAAADDPRGVYPKALIGRDRFVINDLREVFGALSSFDIAELSIGDGRMTRALLRGLANAHLTCVEISELRIEQTRRGIKEDEYLTGRVPDFKHCNLDSEFGGLRSGVFEAVIALDIMEHVLDVFGFVSNCCRILKPEGRLYLRVPNIAYIKHRLGLLAGRLPVTASWFGPIGELGCWRYTHGWDGGHLHFFTIPVLRQLLTEEGLQVASCQDPGTRWESARKLWPSLLFSNPLIVATKKLEK